MLRRFRNSWGDRASKRGEQFRSGDLIFGRRLDVGPARLCRQASQNILQATSETDHRGGCGIAGIRIDLLLDCAEDRLPEDLELVEDLLDGVSLRTPQRRETPQLRANEAAPLQRDFRLDHGIQHRIQQLGNMVEQRFRGEDTPRFDWEFGTQSLEPLHGDGASSRPKLLHDGGDKFGRLGHWRSVGGDA